LEFLHMRSLVSLVAVLGSLGAAALAGADVVAFDQMSGQPSAAYVIPSGGGSAASTGNRFMGVPVNLGPSNNVITGFDTTLVNNTGAAIDFQAGWQVALNYWIYNQWNPGSTPNLAFSDLAGSGSVIAMEFTETLSMANDSFFFVTANSPPGAGIVPPAAATPGVSINPVTVASGQRIGIVLNWTINRNDGAGFVQLGGLTQLIVGDSPALPPAVGSNAASGPNMGYYRSANNESDGNFRGNSWRNIGANSGLLLRIYAQDVPAPGALALLGLAGIAGNRRRR
jgi:MYXO-CTERM domain-containing protein